MLAGLLLVIALAITVVLVFGNNLSSNPSDADSEIITFTTDKPDETKPDKDSYKWKGKPTDPRYISLPSIKAEGFVQKVGVDQNRQVAAPNNVHMAAWFVDTVLPGQKGLSIVDAHVSGPNQPGIFKNLGKLRAGDTFTVEFGNGTLKKFKVFEKTTVPEAEAAALLFNQDPTILSQLNLITCAGRYDKSARSYTDRTIVYAEAL